MSDEPIPDATDPDPSDPDAAIPTPEELEREIELALRWWEGNKHAPLPAGAATRLATHAHLMCLANASINLTRITNARDIAIKHVLDSLFALEAVDLNNTRVCDIGTGAGFPGIPLAIATPSASFVLLDGTEKKIHFVDDVIETLALPNAAAVHARAEVHLLKYDYDYLVARAVGPLDRLLPLLLSRRDKFLALVALKGPGGNDEWHAAYKSGAARGFELVATHETELPDGLGVRNILVISPTGSRHLKPQRASSAEYLRRNPSARGTRRPQSGPW
ncbi:MAG: 16S rRNA (guanine(527)-N(7))-methyltransferase RsmG [Planctomycetes bacterium]|nr:16S rRNA (guanine(527)-N(7))-methyltransferase RsmG [Planctomycetota bacterium]